MAAILLGALVAFVALREVDGSATLAPPCDDAHFETPDGRACATESEVCNAYYNAPVRESVTCTADSRDGRGFVRYILAPGATAVVRVLDENGDTIYTRTVSNTATTDVDSIEGADGTWTLAVAFDASSGSGRIELWG